MKKIILIVLSMTLFMANAWSQEISSIDPKEYTPEELVMIRDALKIKAENPNDGKGTPFKTGNMGTGVEIAELGLLKETSKITSSGAGSSSSSSAQDGNYSWVLSGNLGQGESLFNDGEDYILTLRNRKLSDFNAMVSRFKQHGFTIDADESSFMGMNMYEASSAARKRCSIIFQTNGSLIVNIENE